MAPRRPFRRWMARMRGAGWAVCLGLMGSVLSLGQLAAAETACTRHAAKVALAPGAMVAGFASGEFATWYEGRSDAYGHGIMGDVPDGTVLVLAVGDGSTCRTMSIGARRGHVFEDVAPRLVDLDDDGSPEVLAVRSSFELGAQAAVYGVVDGRLSQLAATPYIGTRHRWLAPAAWEDLDGDGAVEIAYVDRPHLAKVLRVWRYVDGRLREVAALSGVTNHAIGQEAIQGGVRSCGRTREMVLLSADRSRHLGVTLAGRTLASRDLGAADGAPLGC